MCFRQPEIVYLNKGKPYDTNNKTANEKWKPVPMDLKGEAGKRVLNTAVREVMKRHAKEIKALADK